MIPQVFLLGAIQGLTEWIPVSSQGVLTVVQVFLLRRNFSEALDIALWLHIGTALAATFFFRKEVLAIVREAVALPRKPSPLLRYLVLSTLVSVVPGLPLLLLLDSIPQQWGMYLMAPVGVFLVVTGLLQIKRPENGVRVEKDLGWKDAVLCGIAQGLAALPGISRSGLTVFALLARGIERTQALRLSFLMSIPVSIAAGLLGAAKSESWASSTGIVGTVVALVVGLLILRGMMSLARRVNFAYFVIVFGILVLVGSGLGLALRGTGT